MYLHEGKGETCYDTNEVDTNGHIIRIGAVTTIQVSITFSLEIQEHCCTEEYGSTHDVRPDIYRLIMDTEYAL